MVVSAELKACVNISGSPTVKEPEWRVSVRGYRSGEHVHPSSNEEYHILPEIAANEILKSLNAVFDLRDVHRRSDLK